MQLTLQAYVNNWCYSVVPIDLTAYVHVCIRLLSVESGDKALQAQV